MFDFLNLIFSISIKIRGSIDKTTAHIISVNVGMTSANADLNCGIKNRITVEMAEPITVKDSIL